MPQLNPEPWFLISTFSWAVLLVIVLPLVLARAKNNEPCHHTIRFLTKSKTWYWPWA